MPTTQHLRMVTYNVHRCIGRDGKLSPERIARTVAELNADVVALQELDIGHARTGFANQIAVIGEALAMNWSFFPAIQYQDEHYGDAILSRYPMQLRRAAVLPTLPEYPHIERRGALWMTVQWGAQPVHVITTHLGLKGRERVVQAEALLGPEWLDHPDCRPPLVLCGDFNAVPGSRAYRKIEARLVDPFPWRSWPPGTFPAGYPLLRIDHVFLSSNWKVHRVEVPRTALTRIASDHLPLLVEASLG